MYLSLLKEMFKEMVIHKKAFLIPHYYHRDFLLYTNEETMDYDAFLKTHVEIYETPIQYRVEYDEETLLEQGERVAGRIWITIQKPNEPPRRIEVMLIAQYKERKLYRLWELTYPDWSQLPAFKDI